MRKTGIKRPSPALVIAILALFVAGSGGAYAASKITTNQIKKGAITSSKIRKQAVNTSKLKKEAVGTAKLKDQAVGTDKLSDQGVTTDKLGDQSVTSGKLGDQSVTSGKLGDQAVTAGRLADGAVGANKLGNIVVRTGTTTVAPGNTGSATAVCLGNEKLISGGYSTPVTNTSFWLTQEDVRDSAQNGWRVSGFNAGAANMALTVTAYCLAP